MKVKIQEKVAGGHILMYLDNWLIGMRYAQQGHRKPFHQFRMGEKIKTSCLFKEVPKGSKGWVVGFREPHSETETDYCVDIVLAEQGPMSVKLKHIEPDPR